MRRSLPALTLAALLASPAAAQITPYPAGPTNQSSLAMVAPTAPTAANNNQIATTAWVNNLVNAGLPLASGKIWIGSVGNVATAQTPSGDLTMSNAGVFTFGTVNANVGSFGSATLCTTITVNAKGLITAASAATCTPAVGSITGLAAGIATWLGTPSSANLRAALTDESGTGAALFQSGDLGTPTAGVITNLTGTCTACTANTFTAGSAANLTSGILPNARLNLALKPEGRLTLTTGTPVMTSTVSAAGTVFYTPAVGNLIPIYDGTNFTPTAFTELSNVNANSATGSAGPAAVANNSCYDYFVWSNAGTPTLTRGPLWTSTTARSAGTAIARTNGVLLNTQSITNGPAANRGTYVGTACSNGTATMDWILGGSASGGVAAVFNVWNYYNRVTVSTMVSDTGAGYTYSSATIRQARASAGNQITFVAGLVEDGFSATMVGQVNTAATTGSAGLWSPGLNSTSTFACGRTFGGAATAAATNFGAPHTCNLMPALGLNIISANEAGDGVTTVTFDNNSLDNLSATLRM